MKVLFIGGTGVISSAVSELAVQRGIELYHMNRGQSHRQIPGVKNIQGNIRDVVEAKAKLKEYHFDVVVNWINFVPEHVKADIDLFTGKTDQYIFVSSASAYQKPLPKLPVTEDIPVENAYWAYSQNKADCEKVLMDAYHQQNFPVTIVRPSHTYDRTMIPTGWGYTIMDRMLKGKKVIIHGDGTSLWVLTYHTDFAVGFTGLMGKQEAIGEAYHITSDELLTWNQIFQGLADELNVQLNPVHIPSDCIAHYAPERGAGLLGDKAHSVIFDNTKIKTFVPEFSCKVPYSHGIKEVVAWYRNNPSWQMVDENINKTVDTILAKHNC